MRVPPTKSKLQLKREGKSINRYIELPVAVIDTREQLPYSLEFPNWIKGVTHQALKTADYSIVGYESVIGLERKTLNDIVGSLMSGRKRFINEMERLADFKYKCLCIEATREDLKSEYQFAEQVKAHPNAIVGSLDAISARFGINVMYACDRGLAEEFAASWLSKCYYYEALDEQGFGKYLQTGDL